MNSIVICALYHFVRLEDYKELRQPLFELMRSNNVRGTLLLAKEGINGTVAGTREAIDGLLSWLRSDPRFEHLTWKESYADDPPFHRSKVKLKREIVTMGIEDMDPNHITGTYVEPREWNKLISGPDVVLIDTRNEYEVQIGTFNNAVNPHTHSFREFPDYVKQKLDPRKHKKVAMFCTGGIRCEKSTAYLKALGFEEVYHLEGGILNYLEQVPQAESLWQGECFVFDNRVTVNHQLQAGSYDQCHACRMPITCEDKKSPAYTPGISCPHCIGTHSDGQLARFREREKQMQLAGKRGESHIGADAISAQQQHRKDKQQRKEKQRSTNSC